MATTLQDIADRAGVSRMAASLVLNSRQYHRVSPETRQRIEAIARELDYRPNRAARQLKGGPSGVLGLLMPRSARPLDLDRLVAIESRATDAGYRLMVGHIAPHGSLVEAYLDDFEDRRVEGVIWIGHQQFTTSLVNRISRRLRHVVLIGEPVPARTCHIRIDQADGSVQAVNHLLETGRRRIALVLGFVKWIGTHQRIDGYKAALHAAGLQLEPELIHLVENDLALPRLESDLAKAIVQDTIVKHRADALIAQDDQWAATLIAAMRRQGLRVPQDVAVVGQDNSELAAYFDPAITSLDRQPQALAESVLRLLLRSIHQNPPPEEQRVMTVPLKLVIRESTAASSPTHRK